MTSWPFGQLREFYILGCQQKLKHVLQCSESKALKVRSIIDDSNTYPRENYIPIEECHCCAALVQCGTRLLRLKAPLSLSTNTSIYPSPKLRPA